MNRMMETYLHSRVIVTVGDITSEKVDGVVNAANSSLMGGGGVDGAIHAAGGPAILNDCKQIRKFSFPDGLPTGEAVITAAGNLPARYVIHTVGPIYGQNQGRDGVLLANCYRNSVKLGAEYRLRTLAFPSISTGVYGYPKKEAAAVVSQAITDSLQLHEEIVEIRLVFFSAQDAEIFIQHNTFPTN
ncbi:MAG: O-acetyl-ADP-ribose deacetylase [Pyrinomonadaceae bacterium]